MERFMKFIKGINYPLVLLILYVIKSVVLPGTIDLGIIAILSITFVLQTITNKYFDTKVRISTEALEHDRFKFLESNSEDKFQAVIERQIKELSDDVSSVKQGLNLRNGIRK